MLRSDSRVRRLTTLFAVVLSLSSLLGVLPHNHGARCSYHRMAATEEQAVPESLASQRSDGAEPFCLACILGRASQARLCEVEAVIEPVASWPVALVAPCLPPLRAQPFQRLRGPPLES